MATIISLPPTEGQVVYDILDTLVTSEKAEPIAREIMDRHDLTEAEFWAAVKTSLEIISYLRPTTRD